jgi:hypothetical protein
MLKFLIGNIFVVVGGQAFKQSVGINFVPLLEDIFIVFLCGGIHLKAST